MWGSMIAADYGKRLGCKLLATTCSACLAPISTISHPTIAHRVSQEHEEHRLLLLRKGRPRRREQARAAQTAADAITIEQLAKQSNRATMKAFAKLEAKLQSKRDDAPVATNQRARQLSEPVEPEPQECCGNDCPLCVWVVYWEQQQAWEKQQAAEAAQAGVDKLRVADG